MKALTACIFLALNLMMMPFARWQDHSKKFGDVSMDELNLTSCSWDPGADAMVFYDIGKSSFVRSDNGFYIVFDVPTNHKYKLKVSEGTFIELSPKSNIR